MIEESNSKKKKLSYIIIILISIISIGTITTYTYFTNSLNSALKRSLETFNLVSVSSTPLTEGVELNITYILQNPTAFPITIKTIAISFAIDNIDIGGKNIDDVNNTVSARESSYFYFFRHVTDETVLRSFQNVTYKLSVAEGSWISGSTKFLLLQAHATKSIASSEIINNT